jgi:hypothetical protein
MAEPGVDEAADWQVSPDLAAAAAALGLEGPAFQAPEAEVKADVPPAAEASAAEPETAAAEPVEVIESPIEQAEPEATPPPDWGARPDATEVYPTTWAPPPPPPPRTDAQVEPRAGDIRTRLGRAEPETELDDDVAEEVTTAEQAVPWLIGVILLLAGMVIVLLALIFAGDASLGGGGDASPTPALAVVPSVSARPSASSRISPSPSPRESPKPSASAEAVPKYGDLEMVYQGRSTALAPIYLLRRDFTVEGEPDVLAQDPNLDVRRFAWSPDGRRGAFLYADRLMGTNPGVESHHLSDGISAITFGDDAETVYAVRARADGGNDVVTILVVNQETGHERELDSVTYPRPAVEQEAAVEEAQFSDDGGSIRLYWMHDDTLRLWILGAGAWSLDPAEGNARKLDDDKLPVLWAGEGERRIKQKNEATKTRLTVIDRAGDEMAQTVLEGRVSHVRWSPRGDQVVFTLGQATPGGGVLQNLYLWNLNRDDPVMITNTGAAFGAEWRGSQPRWEAD